MKEGRDKGRQAEGKVGNREGVRARVRKGEEQEEGKGRLQERSIKERHDSPKILKIMKYIYRYCTVRVA